MKKRRTIIISLLLVAALALGIGYAAISGSLIIDGKVVAKAQPFNVHFVGFEAGTSTHKYENIPAITCDTELGPQKPAKTIMLNVRDMAAKDDSIFATLKVKNDNQSTMYVSVDTLLYGNTAGSVTDSTAGKFTVTTDWGSEVKTLAAGAETTIKVTVVMNEPCTDAYEGYFRLTLNGNSVAPSPTPTDAGN